MTDENDEPKPKMTHKEKVELATKLLTGMGYTKEAIAEIIKLSFGDKPKGK